jgi:3-oxoadipate enol-lactonase
MAKTFTLAYDDEGEGVPLLMIHGFPLTRAIWQPQHTIGDSARLLAVDLPGHGTTPPLPGPYSVAFLAEKCRDFLDYHDVVQPAVICGLSMGGYVAFEFFRQFPSRVAGLILCSTRAGADSPEGKAKRDEAIAAARQAGTRSVVESMLPKILSPKTYAEDTDLVARVKKIMQSVSLDAVLAILPGLRDRPDSTATLGNINRPTLILHGEDDQIIPPTEALSMFTAIPHATLQIIPAAGHLVNMEQPFPFNTALRKFLEQFSR